MAGWSGGVLAQGPSSASASLSAIAVEGATVTSPQVVEAPEPSVADTASVLADVPGGANLGNGDISGETQFRGLSSYRNDVRIDGMGITSGGPNWMDPPLHYAPAAIVEDVTVTRGVTSVADSVDHIGTTVDARTRKSRYRTGSGYGLGGRLDSTLRSVNNSHTVAGQAEVSNDSNRIGVTGVTDGASDTQTPYGRIRASSYQRDQYGLDFGHLDAHGETSGFIRRQETGRTGTPALPLDIEFFDTNMGQLRNVHAFGDTTLTSQVSFNHVEHKMTNYELRPAPDIGPLNGDAADPRFIRARSQGYSAKLGADHPLWGGTVSGGFDGHWSQHDARVGNPDNPGFSVDAFDSIRRDYYSGYGQWAGTLIGPWAGELGARYTRVVMDAGEGGVSSILPGPAQNVADQFAAADRHQTDDNVDLVAKLSRAIGERWNAHLGLARKTRSPYYIERYAYIPLEATAGLADGNNHIGDIELDPEVSYEINLGTDFSGERLSFSPQIYYKRVNDYITGVPFDDTPGTIDSDVERVSAVNGDPTPLQYANVDAELYGADLDAGYALTEAWRVDGGVSYVRGKRRDIDDDLYRIAPPNTRLALTYDKADWRARITQRYVFKQTHISETNNDVSTDDPRTGGYALTDVRLDYRATRAVTVTVGIDNLWNKGYRDFLSGYNRVNDSDIGLGQRLPGAGRNAYAGLSATF